MCTVCYQITAINHLSHDEQSFFTALLYYISPVVIASQQLLRPTFVVPSYSNFRLIGTLIKRIYFSLKLDSD